MEYLPYVSFLFKNNSLNRKNYFFYFNLFNSRAVLLLASVVFLTVLRVFFVLLCFLRQKVRFVPLATLHPLIFLQRFGLDVRFPLQRLFPIIYIYKIFMVRHQKILHLLQLQEIVFGCLSLDSSFVFGQTNFLLNLQF